MSTTRRRGWTRWGRCVCGFDVYDDFQGYDGKTVYKHTTGQFEGGHVMLIVGYDDNQSCWFVKNSWGSGWGAQGYPRIGYGQCNIDSYSKFGLSLTNPDPWTKRRLHSGNIFESGDGANHRNFEMLIPGPGGSLVHWWRNGDVNSFPWSKAETFGSDSVGSWPAFMGTTYNRNFETIYVATGNRLHHWFFDQSSSAWKDGGVFGPTNAAGVPAFIQSNYGAPGNFEVVVATSDQKLNHWWRDDINPGFQWHDGGTFGSNVAFSGATLVQSQFGTQGNFELVCTLDSGQMQHWWRNNDDPNKPWVAGVTFGSGIESHPCMIEGMYGATTEYSAGNFELCVAAGGMVQHWWRDNSNSSLPWSRSATFGDGQITAVAGLLEGSFGFNLELIVERADGHLQHYYRDGNLNWNAGEVII